MSQVLLTRRICPLEAESSRSAIVFLYSGALNHFRTEALYRDRPSLDRTVATEILISYMVLVPDEVVKRPASIVQKLIENTLDAGAIGVALPLNASGVKHRI
ncbi:hypothetical protein [Candidatus Vallotia lariciata]|uniref:hypothetical protein n=1 Tax=Candidatus Vallotia laricis TaxID=2018052 RepID=UPI001D01D33E|nr:hypothetical protein [Candidatus Vallotia lariciata]